MQDQARMFSDDSNKLATTMRKRALKMKIIIGVLVLAVLLYIIFGVLRGGDDDDDKGKSAAPAQTTGSTTGTTP